VSAGYSKPEPPSLWPLLAMLLAGAALVSSWLAWILN
jgi:hypothetical protein